MNQHTDEPSGESGSLYWTASFYVSRDDLSEVEQAAVDAWLTALPGSVLKTPEGFDVQPSTVLRDAIDPLMNDIAGRERPDQPRDHLFASSIRDGKAGPGAKTIRLQMPSTFNWKTEGFTVSCKPPAEAEVDGKIWKDVELRRFWYLQGSGALSWHVSFAVDYKHVPADFYFLTMLQKVLAPKEFESGIRLDSTVRTLPAVETGKTRTPIDGVEVLEGAAPVAFWVAIAGWLEADSRLLFDELKAFAASVPKPAPARRSLWRTMLELPGKAWRGLSGWAHKEAPDAARDLFGGLVRREHFLEMPGLMMPRCRSMFFFQDGRLFDRLLPAEGSREDRIEGGVHDAIIQTVDRHTDETTKTVTLDGKFWTAVGSHEEALDYLFLSGFAQNIIDFLKQEESEVEDSISPIYPASDGGGRKKHFFVRFANPRAFTTFVKDCRSLECGVDYIGACPYAFLIHVTALHNEFLAIDTTIKADEAGKAVKELSRDRKLRAAAKLSHEFQEGPATDRYENTYENIFRYQTEIEVFDKLRRRWEPVVARLKEKQLNLEKGAAKLNANMQNSRAKAFTSAATFLGLFGFIQVVLQVSDMLQRDEHQELIRFIPGWLQVALTHPLVVPVAFAVSVVIVVWFIGMVIIDAFKDNEETHLGHG